jgi:tRNA1Val (adenine37-N6)-methyltransferase
MKVTTDACLFGAWVAGEVRTVKPEVRRALDIGAGTGLLSLMLAQQFDIMIDAVEMDKPAAEQATENIALSPWKEKINVMKGDIKDFTDELAAYYDIVISNPPFYEKELKSAKDQKNIAHHDEGLRLDQLLPLIKNRLLPTSRFYLLLPYKRRSETEILFKKNNLFFLKKVLVRQSVNHNYFRILIAGSLHNDFETEESELSIRNDKDQYTPEFTKLLKDYYLYL